MTEKSNPRDDDFLKSHGQNFFDTAKSGRSLVEERWQKSQDLYDGKLSDSERKWSTVLGAPRLFIQKTYANLQRILVEVIDTFFFDAEEIVEVKGNRLLTNRQKQIIKAVMNHRLTGHPINFFQEVYEAGLDALKNKICVFKVWPKLRTEMEEKVYDVPDPETGEPVKIARDEEVIKAYEPGLATVPPEDIFFDRNATWKDYWRFPMCHRYSKTRAELKRMGYKNVDEVSPVEDLSLSDPIKTQRHQDTQSPFAAQHDVKEIDRILVYEFWSFMPSDEKNEMEGGSFVMLGDQSGPAVLARGWERNELPYKFSEFEENRPPFVVGVAFPEAHKLYGRDFPELTEAQQQEINADANQTREAIARALRPSIYINREGNVDLMSLLNRRIGGYVQGDGPPGQVVQELPTMNPASISSYSQQRIDKDYYEISGIPPNLLGLNSNEETATAATQQLTNANKKIALIVKSIAFTGIIPTLNYLSRLEQVYESDEYIQKVAGEALGWGGADDDVPRLEDIQGDFTLTVNIGMNKQAQLNKWFMVMDRMTQTNQVMAQLVQMGVADPKQVSFGDPMKVFSEAVLPILNIKNAEEWKIQSLPPPPQAQEAPGIASQPRLPQDPSQQVANMNPEATGIMNVI